MKVLVYHGLVLLYYLLFCVRFVQVAEQIFKDMKPIADNRVVVLTCLCTFWNLVLQKIYFIISLVIDVRRLTSTSKDAQKPSSLEEFSTTLFTRYVFPFAVVVSVDFWLLFLYDPSNVDEYGVLRTHATAWDNHRMHSMVVVLAVFELLVTHKRYPDSVVEEMKRPVALLLLYFCVMRLVQPFSTIWVYPFLSVLSWYHWAFLIAANIALTCLAYLTGKFISRAVWGVEPDGIDNPTTSAVKQDTLGSNYKLRLGSTALVGFVGVFGLIVASHGKMDKKQT